MLKQFLLNKDGSIPANVNIELLKSKNIPLVIPTTMPREVGMIAVEREPERDSNGIWHQVWALEPEPEIAPQTEPEQSVDLLASLTNEQKQALLAFLTKP